MQIEERPIRLGVRKLLPSDLAGRYLLVLAAVAGWVFETIVSIALGLNRPAPSSPLLTVGQRYPMLFGSVILLVVALSVAAIIIHQRERRHSDLGPMQSAATYYIGFVVTLGYLLLGAGASILFGFTALPDSSPLLLTIQAHPTASIAIALLLVAITVAAFLLHPKMRVDPPRHGSKLWRLSRTWASVVISTVSCVLFTALLLTVLFRPPWCPQAICPAPIAITDPTGIHDTNLDVYSKAVQSSVYVIPDDQLLYPSAQLPESIGAVRIDQQQFPPYRVVVGIHSLQRGKYGLVIESVALRVVASEPLPAQVNVWSRGADREYNTNPFLVRYEGQPKGAQITSAFLGLPGGHVQLLPGEGDQLDVRVLSTVPVRLSFQIAITYRVSNDSFSHPLLLPTVYEVVFSDATHWVQYQYKDGHFVP